MEIKCFEKRINDNQYSKYSNINQIKSGNEYYIMDLNSTNKTFINGVKLVPNEEKELHDGDNVRLGNEEFVFHI
jgi:pSer/pThr/pTyr-binding forkhead associated (FHA) protein